MTSDARRSEALPCQLKIDQVDRAAETPFGDEFGAVVRENGE